MTYTHTACLDGGTYTYTLNWGDNSGGDITEAGVTLADGEAKEYTHVYETKGIYSASFKVEVSFPNDSMLSNEEMRMWEINNETCSLYRTEAPSYYFSSTFNDSNDSPDLSCLKCECPFFASYSYQCYLYI